MWNSTPVAVKKMTLPKYNLQMFKKITDELLVEVELYSVGWQKHGRALIKIRVIFVVLMQYTLRTMKTRFL